MFSLRKNKFENSLFEDAARENITGLCTYTKVLKTQLWGKLVFLYGF